MSIFDRFFGAKQDESNEAISSAVINQINTQPSYPDANYASFSQSGYMGNELVFACVREIATSSAEANLRLYDQDHIAITNTPLSNILKTPAEETTQYDFLETLMTQLNIAGNVYVLKERGALGVVSLMLLRPDRVTVLPGRGYQYDVSGARYIIPDRDVGHLKFPNPQNDFYGLSPIQPLLKQISLDTSATDFTRTFFNNAGVPSGLLKLKRKINSADEAEKLRVQWRSQFQGTRNWHRIAILDEDATYETMGSSISQMEIPDLRVLSESRICSAFGVPPILVGANVGLQRSTFSNYREARESFWEETLLPMYRRVEQFMVKLLESEFPREQGTIAFDFSEVRALQEDEDAMVNRKLIKAQIANVFINSGFTPASALQVAGIGEDMDHTGYLPTTLNVLGNNDVEIKSDLIEFRPKQISQAAANRLVEPLEESYDEDVNTLERVLEKFFRNQQDTAAGIIGRYLSDPTSTEVKTQLPFNEFTIIPVESDAQLRVRMTKPLLKTMQKTWHVINARGPFMGLPFDPESPLVQNVIRKAGTTINDVSRVALRKEIQNGLSSGYSMDQIARGVPKDNYRGLQSVVRETYKNRAKTVARTETAMAQNTATAARYRASGVTHVIIRDGDDDDLCAPYNGTRQTLEWALENPIAHPNCTRAYAAIVEGVSD